MSVCRNCVLHEWEAADDAVYQEMTNGGFGSYLLMGNEWAPHAATRRSVELFAEYVMPVGALLLIASRSACDARETVRVRRSRAGGCRRGRGAGDVSRFVLRVGTGVQLQLVGFAVAILSGQR